MTDKASEQEILLTMASLQHEVFHKFEELDALRAVAEAVSCLQMQINMESDFFIPLIKTLAAWRELTGKGGGESGK